MSSLRVGALQMDLKFENPWANCQALEQEARVAARKGADVLITPEMFSTGFSMNTELVAQESGSTLRCICECARSNNVNIIAGYSKMMSDGRFANVAVVVARNGEVIHEYCKTYLFSPLYENRHFQGGEGTSSFSLEGVRMALAICYDLRFPELFRAVASEIDAFVVLASWPKTRRQHWDTLLRARAIENQAYVVGVNRVGEGGGLSFNGGSAVVAPDGSVLSFNDGDAVSIWATINSDEVNSLRKKYPFLSDMK